MSEAGVNGENNLVELRTIRKSFGENVVLDGIDLSIGRGEVVVIAGPSGSGKSTMLRCINGLETVDEGEVRFDGRSVSGAGKGLAKLRAEIGMVFQQFNLFAHKTVMENVTLAPIEVKGLSKADARSRGQKLLEREVFLFVGVLFIIFNYALSRLSRRLEIREKKRSGSKPDIEVRGLEEQVA